MKKCTRVMLIIAGSLFALGLILTITGFLCGGRMKSISLIGGREINYMSIDEDYSNTTIENLDFEISTGKVYIEEGDAFRVSGSNIIEDTLEVEVKNNTLYMKDKDNFPWNLINHIGIFLDGGESKITVTIPKDTVIKNTEIEVKAGALTIDKLNTDVFDLDVDAGKATLDHLSVNNNGYISMDAGSVNGEDYSGNNLEVDVSAGNLDLSGAFYNTLDIHLSAGRISIDTSLGEEEYSYDLDQNAGSIRVNDNNYKEYNDKNTSAKNKIKAKCEAGFITIETK